MATRVTGPSAGKRPARVLPKKTAPRNPEKTALPLLHERMSKVDTAWLRMDHPGNLMQITGMWQLAAAVKYAAVCERIETPWSATIASASARCRTRPARSGWRTATLTSRAMSMV